MPSSRRSFLQMLGLGAAAGAATRWPLAELSAASIFEPSRQPQPNGPILLDSNENAYGPTAKVLASLQSALVVANRYEHGEYEALINQLASLHRVQPSQVLLGCGSTEILRIAAATFLGPQKKLILASPTFEAIAHDAARTGAEIISVPLNRQFSHDLEAMLARATSPGLVYICNPNNPTGSLTPRKDIENFIARLPANVYVLIDEAYYHFAGTSAAYSSFLDNPVSNPRVIVIRTFSKIYGLAGMRLGYGIASAPVIERMRPHSLPDSVNTIVARSARTALLDTDAIQVAIQRNADDRQEFMNRAQTRNLNPIPSYANFFMMYTGRPVQNIIQHFKDNNILVGRPFPPMNTFLRVSLGTPSQMQEFWRVWDLLHIQMQHH